MRKQEFIFIVINHAAVDAFVVEKVITINIS